MSVAIIKLYDVRFDGYLKPSLLDDATNNSIIIGSIMNTPDHILNPYFAL